MSNSSISTELLPHWPTALATSMYYRSLIVESPMRTVPNTATVYSRLEFTSLHPPELYGKGMDAAEHRVLSARPYLERSFFSILLESESSIAGRFTLIFRSFTPTEDSARVTSSLSAFDAICPRGSIDTPEEGKTSPTVFVCVCCNS